MADDSSRLRRAGGAFARRVRTAVAPSGVDRTPSSAGRAGGTSAAPDADAYDRILASGLFRADFYAAQTGIDFADERAAAEHYVSVGMPSGATGHELVSLSYLPRNPRQFYRSGRFDAFASYFRSEAALGHAWGPQFDPRVLFDLDPENTGPVDPALAARALEALVSFGEDELLPAEEDVVPATYRRVREIAHEVAVARRGFDVIDIPGRYEDWDARGEAEWLASAPEVPSRPRGTTPFVSVVVPVWNRAEAVALAIHSVQAQTFGDFELIVVDDGSDDDTPAVLAALAAGDDRIRVFHQANAGVGAARNHAVGQARGEYVAFLDSDNTWRPEFLGRVAAHLESSEADAATAALRMTSPGEEPAYFGMQVTGEQLAYRNYIDLNTLLVKRTLLIDVGGFDVEVKRWNDHDAIIRISQRTAIDYLPFIGCDYQNDDTVARISTTQAYNWKYAVVGRNLVDWSGEKTLERETGLASAVVVARAPRTAVFRSVASLVDDADASERRLQVVVVEAETAPGAAFDLSTAFAADERVEVLQVPVDLGDSVLANLGFRRTRGARVAFVDPRTVARRGWWDAMTEVVESSGAAAVQSLVAGRDGTLETAGFVTTADGDRPFPLLRGFPLQDALRIDGSLLTALSRRGLLVDATAFAAARGFDMLFHNGFDDVDLSLRLRAAGHGLALAPKAVLASDGAVPPRLTPRQIESAVFLGRRWGAELVENASAHYARIGLDLAHVAPRSDLRLEGPEPIIVRLDHGVSATDRRLRWAIKIGADFTPGGDKWGDVPFAEDIARALHELGHDVVVDRHPAFQRRTAYVDDVVLGIRGRHPVVPQPGTVNFLWVISRPDLVEPDELAGFDRVFAASAKWADDMSRRSGREIEVLLQATDPERFHYERGEPDEGAPGLDRVLFVGGPRPPVGRQVVSDAIDAGMAVEVWGPRWEQFVDERFIGGDHLVNSELSPHYRAASVVLNDHFDDMREWGFVNNRLFDAVASGARVVSDHVDGIDEIFGRSVVTYSTVDDLRRIRESPLDETFLSDEERLRAADRILRDHTFATRVARLHEAAVEVMTSRR